MKSTVFSSVAFAALTAFVKADDSTLTNSNCWMELGQYTTGGAFCVKKLPDFNDQGGCMAAQAICVQQYNDCKSNTISTSACLQLNARCQIVNNFCNTYCSPDDNGNNPCTCNLSTVNSWDGVDELSTDSCSPAQSAPAPNNPPAQTLVQVQTAAPVPITPVLIAPDVPCGQCFSDPGNGKRAFEQGPNYAPSGQRMTIGMCMGICQNKGYRYTGVEYGQECWCGNSFLNGAMPAPAASCSMSCAGDKTQTCGASLFMNVYQTGCGAPTTPQSTSASSAVINKYASTAAAQYVAKPSTAAAYNAGNNYQAVKSTIAAYVAPAVKPTTAAYVAPVYKPTSAAYVAPVYKPTTAAYVAPVVKSTTAAAYVTYTPTVGVCSIPTAYAKPIAGFHAPIVACNDGADYAAKPWKRYNTHYTSKAPTYAYGWEAHACTDACTDQYNSCIALYANTFKTYSSYSAYKVRRGAAPKKEKRTWWLGGYSSGASTTTSTAPKYIGQGTTVSYGSQAAAKDTLSSATAKCYAQYSACWNANQYLTTKGTCSAGGIFRAPSTQYGYNTYNAGAKSYGTYNTGNNYITSYGGSTTNNNQYWQK